MAVPAASANITTEVHPRSQVDHKLVDGTASSRNTNIDVLRGLAALAVCAFHFSREQYLGAGVLNNLAQFGYLGVDAFFVISGFVIPLTLWKASFSAAQLPQFLAARFFRLYPAFVFTGIATIGLWYGSSLSPQFRGTAPHFAPYQLIANATLTGDVFRKEWLLPVFWTLAVEAQYYVAIALVFPLMISTRLHRTAWVLAWIAAPMFIPLRASFLPYCALFALGILAFYQTYALVPKRAVAAMAALAVCIQARTGSLESAIVGALSFLTIAYAPRINSRPLVALGTLSYSLYLVHLPIGGRVINWCERWVQSSISRYATFVLAVGVSLAAAWILYVLVERPSHQLAHKCWRGRRHHAHGASATSVAP